MCWRARSKKCRYPTRRGEINAVVQAAKAYLAVAKSSGEPMPGAPDEMAVKDALLRMDAEVLRFMTYRRDWNARYWTFFPGRKGSA